MSLKNLALNVESIALALSEEGGYEYYHIDDDLKELAKNVSDMQAENSKLRELVHVLCYCMHDEDCDGCRLNGERGEIVADPLYACDGLHELLRELGVEVDE